MLSTSANHLYDEHANTDLATRNSARKRTCGASDTNNNGEEPARREPRRDADGFVIPELPLDAAHITPSVINALGVKDGIDTLNKRIGGVEKDVSGVKSRVDEDKGQIDEVDRRSSQLFTDWEGVLNNYRAFLLNKVLEFSDNPIQPILAPVQVGDEQRYTAVEEFPKTIRDFWKLASNSSALAHLARQYSISSWERWGRHGSDNTDATEYNSLEDTVTAHRYKCLRELAITWGLQKLAEQLDYSMQRKRKAATDDGSSLRRVRAREEVEGYRVESIILQGKDGEMFRQVRVTWVGPRIPFTTEIPWSEQYPPMPGH